MNCVSAWAVSVVADRLTCSASTPIVIPMSSSNETIFTALTDYIGGDRKFDGKRLLLKEKSPASEIKKQIDWRGVTAIEPEIYER